MSDPAPRFRTIAASAAIAAGALLFTVAPVVAQTLAPAASSANLPTLAPMSRRPSSTLRWFRGRRPKTIRFTTTPISDGTSICLSSNPRLG